MISLRPCEVRGAATEEQDLALQNCFAQSQAFAFGHSLADVEAAMHARPASAPRKSPASVRTALRGQSPEFPVFMYPQTTARTLGQLLALGMNTVCSCREVSGA